MKKKRNQLILLVIVVLLLLAGIKGAEYLTSQTKEEEKSEVIKLIEVEAERITELGYVYNDQEYAFVKKDGTWYAKSDESLTITQVQLPAMEAKFTPFTASQKIADVQDMNQYGLENPARYLYCVAEGVEHKILLGDLNEFSGDYYVCLPGETDVYIVPSSTVLAFNNTLEDMIVAPEENTAEDDSVAE